MQIIPLIDLRDTTPLHLLDRHADKALDLIQASRSVFGRVSELASYAALPAGDWLARRWLDKTSNPYREEIAAYARILGIPGVYALNLVYEFGCTSGVYATKEGPQLLRVLDWPFRKLGEHLIVAHQKGVSGDFHNVTWPAVSGVYSAMAEGRFAVALNQAPMRRHNSGIWLDWLKNRILANKARGLPPAHLLRKVCETASDYAHAKQMLMNEPVAIPVIYVLAGTQDGEGCVIERLEDGAAVREMGTGSSVNAANHFLSHINGIGKGWMPREIDSCGRALCANTLTEEQAADPLMGWLKPPIANIMNRVCFSANPSQGTMSLMGMEGLSQVTDIFRL